MGFAADIVLDKLPAAEIRKRQDICRELQQRAFDQGNNDALVDMQRMETALLRAMLKRT